MPRQAPITAADLKAAVASLRNTAQFASDWSDRVRAAEALLSYALLPLEPAEPEDE